MTKKRPADISDKLTPVWQQDDSFNAPSYAGAMDDIDINNIRARIVRAFALLKKKELPILPVSVIENLGAYETQYVLKILKAVFDKDKKTSEEYSEKWVAYVEDLKQRFVQHNWVS